MEQVQKLKLDFPTYHPQGMSLVGDKIFLSSVEIIEPTVRYPSPVDGYDRTTGKGRGHVFVLDRQGNLLKDIVLGEDTIYHPGGTDFDGEKIWVPVAEYRPNSSSIVYTIDPDTYEVTEQFRQADHVGGVVADRKTNRVSGVSWGSRKLFTWNRQGALLGSQANPSHFIDYQDCEYAGAGHQLCSGVTGLKTADGNPFELGGLALTDLSDGRIAHEVPFQKFSTAGHSVTRNPVALESDGDVLRLFAAPDDGEENAGTELIIFEARP
ncbi:DUF6454 family protein [Arthrobacter sp. SD76]|uniref:DUF6454 family protein n=1 Tax=Arthrobacter sp. SD76 TaxID=3415007 RepID=UPI003C70FE53